MLLFLRYFYFLWNVDLLKTLNIMYNKILFMNNSFFGRFKKNDNQVIEEQPPVWEDRIFG